MQKILKCVGNPKVNCKGNVGILFSFQLLWLLTRILLNLAFKILISQSRDPTHSRICHQYDKKVGTRVKKISPKTNCPLSPGGTSPSPVRNRGQERWICTYNRGKLPRPRCEKGGPPGETYPSPVSKTVYFTYTRGNFPASYLKNGAKTVYCTYLGASIAPTAVEI